MLGIPGSDIVRHRLGKMSSSIDGIGYLARVRAILYIMD